MAMALADLILFVHVLYAGFVLGGCLVLPLGLRRRWRWVRARAFRLPHLVCTAIVAVEALIGLTCPLTWLEHAVLVASGASGYERSFVGHWLYQTLYYDAPAWVFMIPYTALALAIFTLYYCAPPVTKPGK
jgi:uncharacterized BrkB/YihY/UPF0761 family membrane protein